MAELRVEGVIDGRPCSLAGELVLQNERKRSRPERLFDFLNKPIMLAIVSGRVLALFTAHLENRREHERQEIKSSQEALQRRVSDVELVYGMLPDLARTDEPRGIAARSLLVYLTERARADPELQKVVSNALRPSQDASLRQVALTTEANLAAFGVTPANARMPALQDIARRSELFEEVPLAQRTYLHIVSEQDRPDMESLRESLRNAGIAAPGIERIASSRFPDRSEIRYFHAEDERAARELAALVQSELGVRSRVAIIPGFADKPGTRGLLEVWYRSSDG